MFLSAAKRVIVAVGNPEPSRARMAVSYQREYFADTVTEIAALVEPHWAEVGTYQDEFDRVINYSAYQKLERDRKLLLYTARQDGALIGYIIAVVSLDLHRALAAKSDKPATMARVASMLVYYVLPEKRGYAPALVKAYERELEQRGFHISNTRVKPGRNAADAFFTAMGYSPIEVTYSKLIGEAAHARGSKVA